MFIDKDSLEVTANGKTINLGNYIVDVTFQYPKLWASDSGRNLKGKMSGTLIGIFPKISVNFRRLSKEELEEIAPILDSSTQTLKYYDPIKKQKISISTYTGDWEVNNMNILENQPFSISFIARSKR